MGLAGPAEDASDHPYTLTDLCYQNCQWYAYLDTVDTVGRICRSCPANWPTVACMAEVAGMNQTEACAHKALFPHDPVQYSDISHTKWCRDCVAIHEETHICKDWVEDSLKPEILTFRQWCIGHGIPIGCGVIPSTVCIMTTSEQCSYDAQWAERFAAAQATFEGDEADAEAAELACYQEIYDALKAKCP